MTPALGSFWKGTSPAPQENVMRHWVLRKRSLNIELILKTWEVANALGSHGNNSARP